MTVTARAKSQFPYSTYRLFSPDSPRRAHCASRAALDMYARA